MRIDNPKAANLMILTYILGVSAAALTAWAIGRVWLTAIDWLAVHNLQAAHL